MWWGVLQPAPSSSSVRSLSTPFREDADQLVLLLSNGVKKMAADLRRVWQRLYHRLLRGDIPDLLRARSKRQVSWPWTLWCSTDWTVCAARVGPRRSRLDRKKWRWSEGQAGRRLASGEDIGAASARFMIGAARFRLELPLVTLQKRFTDNFYRTLGRR